MQVNALYGRGVVLAKTAEALRDICSNDVSEAAEVSYLAVPDSLFQRLWTEYFIEGLNTACGTFVDDYEEEFVPVAQLALLEAYLQGRIGNPIDDELGSFCQTLLLLTRTAKSLGHPLLFVF